MAAAEDNDGELPGIRTDPPPPGEDNPYDGATRVGPMSPTAIAKMMRDTEVPASSGLRGSLPRATPVPAEAPDVPALFNEGPKGSEETNTGARNERARDLLEEEKRAATANATSSPEAAVSTPAATATTTTNAPQRPAPAFPDWVPTSARELEGRRTADERALRLRSAAVATLFAVVSGLIVWLLLTR